ncbi:hypothetical protein Tco_0986812 [Tanacetum coccineum]
MSPGNVAREGIPFELFRFTYPGRHVARERYPQRQVARDTPDLSLGNIANVVTTIILRVIGGAIVGTITGAIKGPTTETGLVRGACVGAVTGAITALQLMDMIIDGEPFSKVSFLSSLVNGQVFTDWVTPAVLKAYQWQVLDIHL